MPPMRRVQRNVPGVPVLALRDRNKLANEIDPAPNQTVLFARSHTRVQSNLKLRLRAVILANYPAHAGEKRGTITKEFPRKTAARTWENRSKNTWVIFFGGSLTCLNGFSAWFQSAILRGSQCRRAPQHQAGDQRIISLARHVGLARG